MTFKSLMVTWSLVIAILYYVFFAEFLNDPNLVMGFGDLVLASVIGTMPIVFTIMFGMFFVSKPRK